MNKFVAMTAIGAALVASPVIASDTISGSVTIDNPSYGNGVMG